MGWDWTFKVASIRTFGEVLRSEARSAAVFPPPAPDMIHHQQPGRERARDRECRSHFYMQKSTANNIHIFASMSNKPVLCKLWFVVCVQVQVHSVQLFFKLHLILKAWSLQFVFSCLEHMRWLCRCKVSAARFCGCPQWWLMLHWPAADWG